MYHVLTMYVAVVVSMVLFSGVSNCLKHRTSANLPEQCPDEDISCPSCPPDWEINDKWCYRLYTDEVNQESAKTRCSNQGSTLASIHSAEEDDFLRTRLRAIGACKAWIGLESVREGGFLGIGKERVGFRWIDGTSTNYYRWAPGEPNDANVLGYEDCTTSYINGCGWAEDGWEDRICSYDTRPYCKKKNFNQDCPSIANCEIECCPVPGTSTICSECKDYYGPTERAYRKKSGNTCEKLCSWLSDSNTCFPGTCFCKPETCECAPKFSGQNKNCMEITDLPEIIGCSLKVLGLHNNSQDYKYIECENPPQVQFSGYTNIEVEGLEIKWTHQFRHGAENYSVPAYVTEFEVGVVTSTLSWKVFRGTDNTIVAEGSDYCLNRNMPDEKPQDSGPCGHNESINFVFTHGDRLVVDIIVTNGGYLGIKDYPSNTSSRKVTYSGKSRIHTTTIHLDYQRPYHCAVTNTVGCETSTFLDVGKHIRKESALTIKWLGWRDDIGGISGIDRYEYELHRLKGDNRTALKKHGPDAENGNFTKFVVEHSTILTEPGVYAIYIIAFDNANNHQASRRFVLYDNINQVEVSPDTIMRVETATKNTSYQWLTTLDQPVHLTWIGHFRNFYHHINGFLNEISASNENIIEGYEDVTGQPPMRSREAIPNVRGVTAYFVEYRLDHDGGLSIINNTDSWVSVPEFQTEQAVLNIPRTDGDSVRIFVKGQDVLHNEDIDDIIVHVDSSPPEVQILGLYRGGERRLAVHSNTDLFDMLFEFDAYDEHSGLFTIHWELHDNLDSARVHGTGTVTAAGSGPMNRPDCEPQECVCVPTMQLCYPRNYSMSPDQNEMNISTGVHEFDYMFVVIVTNNAMLVTLRTFKVTVDISPPHPGIVKDNLPGQPDLDFQHHMTHQASWEGFFDKESGVMFYKYGYADRCLSSDDFGYNSTQVTLTYNTWVSHNWSTSGTYYCTVVAFNHANDPSIPVCSNGLTIDITPPTITGVMAKGMFTNKGLAKSSDDTLLIRKNDRSLTRATAPDTCKERAGVIDTDLYTFDTFPNGTTKHISLSEEDCSVMSPARSQQYIATPHRFELSWTVTDTESELLDCFVGISSNGFGYPTILQYQSTHARQRYTIYHTGLSDGHTCYIHIKAMNKAGLETEKIIGPVVVESQPLDNIITSINIIQEENIGRKLLIVRWAYDTLNREKIRSIERVTMAIGDNNRKTHLVRFRGIYKNNDSIEYCTVTDPPSCSAVVVADLGWRLHSNHRYKAIVRIHTIAGHSVDHESDWYWYIHGPPAAGRAWETSINDEVDRRDIDISTSATTVSVKWDGFYHPHSPIQYHLTLRNSSDDVIASSPFLPGEQFSFIFRSLVLKDFENYYAEVTGMTSEGEASTRTDGFTVVTQDMVIFGLCVMDGKEGSGCKNDQDYSISDNTYSAHWEIPQNLTGLVKDVMWQMERYDSDSNTWSEMEETAEYLGLVNEASRADLHLEEYHRYRAAVRLCHEEGCFQPRYSDGFMVLQTPPSPGSLQVESLDSTSIEIRAINISWTPANQPGISGSTDVISRYDWTILRNHQNMAPRHQLLPWQYALSSQTKATYTFPETLLASRCLVIVLIATNKVGLKSSTERQITDCSAVKQPTVLDAVGTWNQGRQEIGDINLETNQLWQADDREFTPSKTTLQAVWPSLRHGQYLWKVVSGENIDLWDAINPHAPMTYLDYHCSSPEVLSCGQTHENFVNIHGLTLRNGARYYVCVFANETIIHNEHFDQILPVVSSCTDGVVVDLDAPTRGRVWIADKEKHKFHQVETMSLMVHWENFRDTEVFNTTWDTSGISTYYLSVSTSPGGEDVKEKYSVGIQTNHVVIHQLSLHPGQRYYVTVTAIDFVGRSTSVTSPGTVVDVSPPEVIGNLDTGGRFHSSTESVSARWHDVFSDQESGIATYLWCLGSRPGHCDIQGYTTISHTEVELQYLQSGRLYFVTVQAINGAGLAKRVSSPSVIVDDSPPTAGFVLDTTADVNDTDVDFQMSRTDLYANWGGFHDQDTGIANYMVAIGTCPGCCDVMDDTHWGVSKDLHLTGLHLTPGTRYFVTITACNGAKSCTVVTSDGVLIDYTPPVAGKVFDGIEGEDAQFQTSSSRLCAHWVNFFDVHSGISHYEWWAGVTPRSDDIMTTQRVHLSHHACTTVSRQLPFSTKLYVSVKAIDHTGLYAISTSNGIVVDTTAPIVKQKASFNDRRGSLKWGSQVWRSSLDVTWEFTDADSGINTQFLSLISRDPSLLSLPTIQLYGDVRHYVFANISLLDGHRYKVKVVGCNGAGLCSHTETDEQLVDNSPPTPGSFAVLTDHAVNLERHRGGYMVYNRDFISIAFLGFADPHSDIQNYHVAVGTFYDGADLVGGSTVRVYHYGQDSHRDEGTIERVNITLTREVQPQEMIYITIWAENKVGLSSRRLHGSFVTVASSVGRGTLELNRRCSSWSCQGHCTCSPQDQTCLDTAQCTNVTGVPGYQTVIIRDADVSTAATEDDKDYTHVTCLMAAEWYPTGTGLSPVRYDWSVGERGAAPGTGLMDRASDVIWRDNGHLTSAVFTVSRDPHKGMLPGKSYAFHVRAWFDAHHYSTYSSDGIIADNQGLRVSRSVVPREIRRIGSLKDIDVTADLSSVNITWKHVFLPGSIPLHHVTISIGTKYGGDDVTKTEYAGSVLEAMLAGLDLQEGVKYYTTVEVVNMGGLYVSSHSDGFVVDMTKPSATSATVSDGAGLHDVRYQRENTSVSAFWHGFVDHQSPLAGYVWCVSSIDGEEILPCTHMGLALSGMRSLPSSRRLAHGQRYVSRVQAVDAGGHVSDFVYSDGFTVDSTAPEKAGHIIGANLLVDGSFETATLSQAWVISTGSAIPWRSSAKDGQQSLLARGTISQVVRNCACDILKVTFWTSTLTNTSEIDHGSGAMVGINSEMHLFAVHDNDVGWQKHCYYFRLGVSNDVTLTFSVGSGSVFLLDSVSLNAVSRTTSATSEVLTVDVLPGSEPGTCFATATWSLMDPESEIKEFQWAIGTVKGGVQLQPFKSVSKMNHARSSKLTLPQGTAIHVTVKTTNGAGMIGVFHAEPVHVDYTPPEIVAATINNQPANGTSYITDIVQIMWGVDDPETPLKSCEYSIGHKQGMSDFLPSTLALNNRGEANLTGLTHGDTLYVNIRCTNNKDMTGYLTTEPVVIVTGPPDSSWARISPVTVSTSVYPTRGHHQSQTTQMRISWTGFSDASGISHYELKTSQEGRVISDWKTVAEHPVQFCDLTNLDLRAYKTYTLAVRAVNHADYVSQDVTATITIEVTKPYMTGASLNSFWNPLHTIHLDWAGMYISNSSLVYDVSVGTYEGGCDVLCAVETSDHKIVVTSVDSSVEHHVIITAVNQAGLWSSSSHVIGHPGNT